MPDPQPPKPLKRFALQRPPLAPPGTVRIDQAPKPPPPFSPWQLWGQGLLEAVVDPVRGALWGATGPEDTLAAKGAETVMAGLPLVAGVKSLMAGRGLYSRVDEALALLPKKGAHPNKIASILKSNASAEELAYRGVPEFLASKGNATVTPGELAAHLAAHPAPVPVVKTLGEGISFDEWLQRTGHGAMTPDDLRSGLQAQLYSQYQRSQASAHPIAATRTKYGQYTLPGGESYRETLVTLPPQPKPNQAALEADIQAGQARLQELYQQAEGLSRRGPDALKPVWAEIEDLQAHHRDLMAKMSRELSVGRFTSGHFDEPNILVHTRANERTLPTGERGRFVEEVQSDWHQKGKKEGYVPANPDAMRDNLERRWGAVKDELTALGEGDTPQHRALRGELADLTDEWNAFSDAIHAGVPDAPFKETWPDLGLKQQVLETAEDPQAQWIGFTSGQTQAARYDLSKQIKKVEYVDSGDKGMWLRAYDHDGTRVMDTAVPKEKLADHIGKEAADKLLAAPTTHTKWQAYPTQAIEGVDLQVGGEGMRHFYDQVLPKRLEKIVKPFGGTVEKAPLGARTKAQIDAEMDAIMAADPTAERLTAQYHALQAERNAAPDADAWIAKLTPAMKARILKEGLPLLSLTAFLAQMGQKPKETR